MTQLTHRAFVFQVRPVKRRLPPVSSSPISWASSWIYRDGQSNSKRRQPPCWPADNQEGPSKVVSPRLCHQTSHKCVQCGIPSVCTMHTLNACTYLLSLLSNAHIRVPSPMLCIACAAAESERKMDAFVCIWRGLSGVLAPPPHQITGGR